MAKGELGRQYGDGEIILRQGDAGDCMFVIQEGEAAICVEQDGREIVVRKAGPGEIIGEMSIFEKEVRCASVRALGPVRALTVDKRTFLTRVHEDPSLAFRIVQSMSRRIRELTAEIARLKGADADQGGPASQR